MNKQELASKIWSGANELRGKVSASSYKDYMLGFIFYKYLSNKEENYLRNELYFSDEDFEKLDESDEETVKSCKEKLGYFIAYKDLFSYWILNDSDFGIKDVRTALSSFNRHISTNYKKVYSGIFDTLEKGLDSLGTGDPERTKASRKLLALIKNIPTDGSQEYDVLGFIYEFLLKNFAANAGKAGEFYTPFEASLVMSEIIAHHLKDRKEISIYDPTSGSGSLLINIGKSVAKHIDNPNGVKYYAQELIENTYNLTRMNLVMRDILPDNIIVRNGDTLADDWPFFDETDREHTYDPVFVDGCCSNPPYSQSWVNDDADQDIRFSDYGVAPKAKADYAFLLHNLYHLKPDGIMTIVLPHGVLFRGGEEAKIRQKLVDNNHIETIIGLPSNIFFGTGIPTIIMVLKKNRETDDILFIDASKGFVKEGNKNRLQAKDVRRIVDTVINRSPSINEKNYARLITKNEIINNEYNLNIPRYVDSSESKDIYDIYATMFGGIPNSELENFRKEWKAFSTLRNMLFTANNTPYSILNCENVEVVIQENEDVKRVKNTYKILLDEYPDFLHTRLIDNALTLDIAKEENELSVKLKDIINRIPLINYYDAYQILDKHWNKIALDLEIIQIEKFESLVKVDPYYVNKKNSKTKEVTEVQEGWVGRILPFELIQDIYFNDKKKELDELRKELKELEIEKNTLLDSIDPIDKAELLKEDSDDIETKKLNAVIAKLKKELKKGAEFEEGSYEDIIIKVNVANENIKKNKKLIKDLNTSLDDETKSKIENLPIEEAINLLKMKWITPLYRELLNLFDIVIEDFTLEIQDLIEKYSCTYNDIFNNINSSKKEVASLIDNLVGNEFDMKGLNEFKRLLDCEDAGGCSDE